MRKQMSASAEEVNGLLSHIHTAFIDKVLIQAGAGKIDWQREPRLMRRLVVDLSAYLKTSPSLIGALLVSEYYQRMGDLDQAEGAVQDALALREDCALCYYKLAYIANLRHERAQAIALLQRALAVNDQLTAAHQALGSLYEQEGEYAKAVQSYQQGLKIDPDNATLLNNLGWITLVELQNPATAYVHIRKAMSLRPHDPDVQDSMAWWYYQNGDIEHAVIGLQSLVQAYPTHALYQYHMGVVSLAQGEVATGRRHLRLALHHGLAGEAAAQARERLPRGTLP